MVNLLPPRCSMCKYWRFYTDEDQQGYCDAPLPEWVRMEYTKPEVEYRLTMADDGATCGVFVQGNPKGAKQ